MMTMGGDFQYQNARINFKNLDKLIHYVNAAAVGRVLYLDTSFQGLMALCSGQSCRSGDTFISVITLKTDFNKSLLLGFETSFVHADGLAYHACNICFNVSQDNVASDLRYLEDSGFGSHLKLCE